MPIPLGKILLNFSTFYVFVLVLAFLPFGGMSVLIHSLFGGKKSNTEANSINRKRFHQTFWLCIGVSAIAWIALLFFPVILS